MGLFRYGIQGAAYNYNFDQAAAREVQLRQIARQNNIDNETRNKLLADDFSFQTASNAYDQKQLDAYQESIIEKWGEYSSSHPNWYATPEGQMERVKIKHALLSNPILLRSQRYMENLKMYNEASQKDPDIAQTPEYAEMGRQIQNYQKYGSVDGVEGNNREFLFQMPNKNDVLEDMADMARKLGTIEIPNSIGGVDVITKSVPDESINLAAYNALNSPRGYRLKSIWNNMDAPHKELYGTPQKWLAEYMKSFTSIGMDRSRLSSAVTGGSNPNLSKNELDANSAYVRDIENLPANSRSYTKWASELAPVTNGVMNVNPEGLFFSFKENDGKYHWRRLSTYAGERFEKVVPTGGFIKGPSGEKFVEVSIPNVEPKREMMAPGTEMLSSIDKDDMQPTDLFRPYISIVKNDKNEPTGRVNLTAYVRAITNPSTIFAYEQASRGQKEANETIGNTLRTIDANQDLEKMQRYLSAFPDGHEFESDTPGVMLVKYTDASGIPRVHKK